MQGSYKMVKRAHGWLDRALIDLFEPQVNSFEPRIATYQPQITLIELGIMLGMTLNDNENTIK